MGTGTLPAIPSLQPCPWQVGFTLGTGRDLPAVPQGRWGLCPRSGRPALLGCPGGEDTRVAAMHVCPSRFKEHQAGPTQALGKGFFLGLNPVPGWGWCWLAAEAGVLARLCLVLHGLLLPIMDRCLPWPHMDPLQQEVLLLASCFFQDCAPFVPPGRMKLVRRKRSSGAVWQHRPLIRSGVGSPLPSSMLLFVPFPLQG